MNDLCPMDAQTCPTRNKKVAEVKLPVCITPYSVTGPATVHCCGEAHITPLECNDMECSTNSCEFVITQKIEIELPVEFGASVKVGSTFIDCDCHPCHDD